MAGTRCRRRAGRITTSFSSPAPSSRCFSMAGSSRRAGLGLGGAKRQAQTADFRPIDLGARFSADFAVEAKRVESHNVLGKIAGSRHPDETIWFAGHWDAYWIGA